MSDFLVNQKSNFGKRLKLLRDLIGWAYNLVASTWCQVSFLHGLLTFLKHEISFLVDVRATILLANSFKKFGNLTRWLGPAARAKINIQIILLFERAGISMATLIVFGLNLSTSYAQKFVDRLHIFIKSCTCFLSITFIQWKLPLEPLPHFVCGFYIKCGFPLWDISSCPLFSRVIRCTIFLCF